MVEFCNDVTDANDKIVHVLCSQCLLSDSSHSAGFDIRVARTFPLSVRSGFRV